MASNRRQGGWSEQREGRQKEGTGRSVINIKDPGRRDAWSKGRLKRVRDDETGAVTGSH